MSALVVFGLGYSAGFAVKTTRARYDRVVATVRSPERARMLSQAGVHGVPVEAHAFDGRQVSPALADAIPDGADILVSVPPGEDGDPVLRAAGPLLAARRPKAIAYFSTVGVYGDHQGGWVDETTEPKPANRRSHERLAAEQAWWAFGRENGLPIAILRLSGIYGPGSNALINVRAGTARRLVKPGQVFNRIHVDDIALAVEATFERRFDGIVNVSDDEPAPPQDVVAYAADLLGLPVPPDIPFDTAAVSEMTRSFYAECKRVANRRLRHELCVNLSRPNFRVALRALAEGGDGRISDKGA